MQSLIFLSQNIIFFCSQSLIPSKHSYSQQSYPPPQLFLILIPKVRGGCQRSQKLQNPSFLRSTGFEPQDRPFLLHEFSRKENESEPLSVPNLRFFSCLVRTKNYSSHGQARAPSLEGKQCKVPFNLHFNFMLLMRLTVGL